MILYISFNGIEGDISGEKLANLIRLVHLDMSRNKFNGSIPAELFHLRFLQVLDFSGSWKACRFEDIEVK